VAERLKVVVLVPGWSERAESVEVVDVGGWLGAAFGVFADGVQLEVAASGACPGAVVSALVGGGSASVGGCAGCEVVLFAASVAAG
jgi:hypothetical protein